jgi:hypothetical protein
MATKATGSVGDGHQNPYSRIGEIVLENGTVLQYDKGNRIVKTITRDKAPCWNADTPVEWDEDIDRDDINADGIPDINTQGVEVQAERVSGVKRLAIIDGKRISPILQDLSDENGEAKVLATRNADGEFTEYHPIIQLFNEVMAAIIRDRMTRDLDRLHSPTSSRRMWQYLDAKYLKKQMTLDDVNDLLDKFHRAQDEEGLEELHP